MDISDDTAMFQRTGSSSPLGKLDDHIDTFRIDAETKAKLQVMAADAGMAFAEFVRLRLHAVAWGEERVASLYADRIRRVLRNGG